MTGYAEPCVLMDSGGIMVYADPHAQLEQLPTYRIYVLGSVMMKHSVRMEYA